ncbi:MAG TPA: ATP-grasp domain-containing protein [Gemmatimonadales bacterium]|nr:ATP-grasp domain-containing protein [Gemmatimonadales bacterium]
MIAARRPRVLVLDAQSTEALACTRSLGRAGHPVVVAGRTRRPLAAWSRHCEASYRLSAETLAAFAALRTWARDHDVGVVLPLSERSCVLCNAERDQWEAEGIVVGCARDDVLAGAFDKAQTVLRARLAGVRTPPTHAPTTLAECLDAGAQVEYPCVVKPRFSNAWNGTAFLADHGPCYASDARELEAAVRARRQGEAWPLIQGFVEGQGKGVFALCDRGRVVAWFAHERLRDVRPSGSGSSLRRAAPLDPRLRAPAERLLCEMRWHGPAMVEFRDDGSEEPCLMEVNGRFWGSLQLAIDAGVDFPRLWLAILAGEGVGAAPRYREDVVLRWLWGDVKRFLYIVAGRPAGYPGRYPTIAQGLRELLGAQPPGTRLEAWDPRDPWPALGEWVQGLRDLVARAGGR